jgi:hypothetical protein
MRGLSSALALCSEASKLAPSRSCRCSSFWGESWSAGRRCGEGPGTTATGWCILDFLDPLGAPPPLARLAGFSAGWSPESLIAPLLIELAPFVPDPSVSTGVSPNVGAAARLGRPVSVTGAGGLSNSPSSYLPPGFRSDINALALETFPLFRPFLLIPLLHSAL